MLTITCKAINNRQTVISLKYNLQSYSQLDKAGVETFPHFQKAPKLFFLKKKKKKISNCIIILIISFKSTTYQKANTKHMVEKKMYTEL